MRRTTHAAAVAAFLLLTAAPAAPAARPETRRYKVDAAQASWAVPKKRDGRYRMWTIDAARYEDLESGEVEVYASVDRLECVGDDSGLSCHGGPMWEGGTPQTFEFADDLTRAAVRLGENEVEWVAEDPVEKPFEFVPGTASRREGCPQGEGTGEGLYRSMRARGTVLGRSLDHEQGRSFVAIERYVLETDCDPSGWWRSAGSRASNL